MKINSKGFIEPEVGETFKSSKVDIKVELDIQSSKNSCKSCYYYSLGTCPFACIIEDRDDKNDVIYTMVADEKL